MKKLVLLSLLVLTLSTYAQEGVSSEKYSKALLEQGLEKNSKSDWTGAITDFTNAITQDPKNVLVYYYRAIARNNIKDYRGAIADYSKAIYLIKEDSIIAAAYYGRGESYYSIGNRSNACMDFNKASGFGHQEATTAVQNYCN